MSLEIPPAFPQQRLRVRVKHSCRPRPPLPPEADAARTEAAAGRLTQLEQQFGPWMEEAEKVGRADSMMSALLRSFRAAWSIRIVE
jgi:hypothetical protein